MNLYEAIYTRASVREYLMEPLEKGILELISQFYKELIPLFSDIETHIEIVSTLEKKQQVSGLFTVKAPYYLILYSEEKEKHLLNGGYIMQHIALFLSTRGIGSCYQGGSKKKESMDFGENVKQVMVLAFGVPKDNYERPALQAKRINMNELCMYKEQPMSWLKSVLEAARLSPSSINQQPWRFVVYENRLHIFEKISKIKIPLLAKRNEFDFGIMIAHIMITAEELWVDIDLIKLENIVHKQLKQKKYVISVIPQS